MVDVATLYPNGDAPSKGQGDNPQQPKDKDWIRQMFLLKKEDIIDGDARDRIYTSATIKYVDTRLGGNFCINQPHQYTRYADPKIAGRLLANYSQYTYDDKGNVTDATPTDGSRGMGRFYSEQIDDNSQWVHLRFGVPQYNGLLGFFTGFYNNDAGMLARTGRNTGLFYLLGRAAGFVTSLYAWPFIAAGTVLKFLLAKPSSKYYYLKPTMGQYWERANTMINALAVNIGLVAPVFGFTDPKDEATKWSSADQLESINANNYSATDRAKFHNLASDIFLPNGGIDIFAVANKAQRAANQNYKQLQEALGGNSFADLSEDAIRVKMNNFKTEFIDPNQGLKIVNDKDGNPLPPLQSYLQNYHSSDAGNIQDTTADYTTLETSGAASYTQPGADGQYQFNPDGSTSGQSGANANTTAAQTKNGGLISQVEGWWQKAFSSEYAYGDITDGSQFVTFRVDYSGSVGESFHNSFRNSDIETKMNGMSDTAKNLRFDMSDGQAGVPILDDIVNAGKEVLSGFATSLHVSGLMSLAGSALVDIPKQWDSSSASFPRADFTIELRCPYGNVMSRFQNLYVPLCLLLAGALPISTGKQSFQMPFLCEYYCKGRGQIRLGCIESLTVTRGTGNIGYTSDGIPLGIDVTFSIIDLSSVMHAPISPGYSFLNPLDGVFDENTAWSDYLAVLSSMGMGEQIYSLRVLTLNLTRKISWFRNRFTGASISNMVLNATPGRMLSALVRAGDRGLGN